MEMPIRQKRRVELYRTMLRAGPLLLEIYGACNVRVVALGLEICGMISISKEKRHKR